MSQLEKYLSPARLERVIRLEETESTNTYLKHLGPDAPDGLAVIARRQLGGRGRVGRSFASPEGGLYLSALYRVENIPAAFTACAAVAVRRAILRSCGLRTEIKWVNDLLLGGKKVCGILVENTGSALIVGVGVNVNTASFPPELLNAGSLAAAGGREYSLDALAAAVIEELDALASSFPACAEPYRAEYAAACVNLGRELRIHRDGGPLRAFAETLDSDFSLIVRLPDGRRENIFFGEVSVRSSDGEYI